MILENKWNLLPKDGEVYLFENVFSNTESSNLFNILRKELHWQQPQIKIFGKHMRIPRETAFYGDSNVHYSYSGLNNEALSWTASLLKIKKKVEALTQNTFNSVLANCYLDGKSSMGWHSDDEKELGNAPTIASVSFGGERVMKFRHKEDKKGCAVSVPNGSVIVMQGHCQKHWQHCIPKTQKEIPPRINLTFRYIY